MKKSTINYLIDFLLFLSLCAVSGIGLLIKYTLPSGQDKWRIYGSNKPMQWLSLDRHQWGDIHFSISLLMLTLLIVHIVLHWSFIINVSNRLLKNKPIKLFAGLSFTTICVILLVFPFLIKPTQLTQEGTNQVMKNHQVDDQPHQVRHVTVDKSIKINGKMTLSDVSETYNIPIAYLKKNLKLPDNTDDNTRLGHLRKQYNFHMSDLSIIINNYRH